MKKFLKRFAALVIIIALIAGFVLVAGSSEYCSPCSFVAEAILNSR